MHPDQATTAKTPAEVVPAQTRMWRRQRGLTQKALAEIVEADGGDLTRGTLAKIECGARGVSLEEVVLLAAALQITPLHLFLPVDDDEAVQITPTLSVSAVQARAWVRGHQPLPGMIPRLFHTSVPDSEWEGKRTTR